MTTREIDVTVASTPFPEGTRPAGVRVSISGPTMIDTQTIAAAPYKVTVPSGLADGDYAVTAQAIDAEGKELGAPVTSTFSVKSVMVDIPQSIAVVVAA